MNTIITISRQFGSGGRTIGRMVAEKLGIPCYDAEIIEKIMEETGFEKKFIEEKGEHTNMGGWLARAFAEHDFYGQNTQDYLWTVQKRIVRELAEKSDCVIVGRCADAVLGEKEKVIRVFIHADQEARAKRIVEQYGERPESPEKRLKDKDKKRAGYYQYYTDLKWGAAEHYDVCLNSAHLGIDRCVDIISSLY